MHEKYGKYSIFNKEVIIRFYKTLKFTGFKTLTTERMNEIDELVEKYRYYFTNKVVGQLSFMTIIAEKLTVSFKTLGLNDDEEKAYFYIKMIDPELKFLEAYESACTKEELKELCMKNFYIFDPVLIRLEKSLNELTEEYTADDLWAADRIKKSR